MSDCFVNPWTVAYQAPLPMGFPRQECWSGLPFPSPGDLLDPEIELTFLFWQADSLPLSHSFPTEPLGKPITVILNILKRSY